MFKWLFRNRPEVWIEKLSNGRYVIVSRKSLDRNTVGYFEEFMRRINMAALEIRIEKTKDARHLEFELGIDFGLSQKHPWDAGYDVRACIPDAIGLSPGERTVIPTGLKIELTNNMYEIQARPRSGLAAKNGIIIVNTPGTIDAGYRDEIKIILLNTDKRESFVINPGDRIAQLCFRTVPSVGIEYVDQISRENDRGGGFGSSGRG